MRLTQNATVHYHLHFECMSTLVAVAHATDTNTSVIETFESNIGCDGPLPSGLSMALRATGAQMVVNLPHSTTLAASGKPGGQ